MVSKNIKAIRKLILLAIVGLAFALSESVLTGRLMFNEAQAATYVGRQSNFSDALKALVELQYAIVDSYEVAIDRVRNDLYKKRLETFKEDHRKNIDKLSDLLKDHNVAYPMESDTAKDILTTSKVKLANLVGDKTILKALRSNEEDVVKAYKRMVDRKDKWSDSVRLLEDGYNEVVKHEKWLKTEASS